MYKLDVQDVPRDGRQTVIGIRCPATIELTDSDETLPGSFIVINEQKPERRNETYLWHGTRLQFEAEPGHGRLRFALGDSPASLSQ